MTYGTTPPAVTYTPSGLQGTDTVGSIGLTVTCTTSATNTSAAGSAQTTSCSGAASTTNYTVSYVAGTMTVNKATQTVTITSTAPTGKTYSGSNNQTYTVTDTGGASGNPVTLTIDATSTSGCTIAGSTVSYGSGAGTCIVDANQAGNTNYSAATQVQQTFNIAKAALTITANNMSMTYGTTPPAVTYTPSGLQGTNTVASIGLTVTCTTSATNTSAAGSAQTTSCSGAASTTNYTVSYVAGTMTVNQVIATVSISNLPASGTYGGSFTPTYTVTPGDTGATSVTSNSTTVCTVSGSTVNYVGIGTCSLTAHVAATTNYAAASGTPQTFNIAKAALTITANNMSMTYGTTPPAVTYTPSGLQGTDTVGSIGLTVTCTTSATNTSAAGSAQTTSCSGAASTTNYTVSYVAGTMTVNKATQTVTITSTAPTSASAGGATYTPMATATSGLTVAITLDATSTGCTLNAGVVSFTTAGSCVIDASQAGNTNYSAAAQAQQSFAVAGLTITGDQFSSGTSSNPQMTLSGAGAINTSVVTVKVCTVNSFPCSGGHTASTVITGATPTNPWTTAATGTTALSYGTNYYAEATQGTQTSPVFSFTTPTQTAPTAVALANGGTTREIDPGDTATVTFSAQLNATTICSGWTNTGTQTVPNATITFTSAGNNDTFAVTSTATTCTGNGNFGVVATGANYVGGTVTFTNSTITWNPTTDTLTFKLGAVGTGSNNRNTVGAGTPGYTASGNVADTSGIPVSTTTFTSGSNSGF